MVLQLVMGSALVLALAVFKTAADSSALVPSDGARARSARTTTSTAELKMVFTVVVVVSTVIFWLGWRAATWWQREPKRKKWTVKTIEYGGKKRWPRLLLRVR